MLVWCKVGALSTGERLDVVAEDKNFSMLQFFKEIRSNAMRIDGTTKAALIGKAISLTAQPGIEVQAGIEVEDGPRNSAPVIHLQVIAPPIDPALASTPVRQRRAASSGSPAASSDSQSPNSMIDNLVRESEAVQAAAREEDAEQHDEEKADDEEDPSLL